MVQRVMLKLMHWHAERVVPSMTRMWRKLGWEEIFPEAQRSGDRQAQLELKDNIASIVRAKDLPHKTLKDIVMIFRYTLVSCGCGIMITFAA